MAIRRKVKVFRLDRGTHIVGSTDNLKIDTVNVENGPVRDFIYKSGTVWIFNPSYSSYMGGVYEKDDRNLSPDIRLYGVISEWK